MFCHHIFLFLPLLEDCRRWRWLYKVLHQFPRIVFVLANYCVEIVSLMKLRFFAESDTSWPKFRAVEILFQAEVSCYLVSLYEQPVFNQQGFFLQILKNVWPVASGFTLYKYIRTFAFAPVDFVLLTSCDILISPFHSLPFAFICFFDLIMSCIYVISTVSV